MAAADLGAAGTAAAVAEEEAEALAVAVLHAMKALLLKS